MNEFEFLRSMPFGPYLPVDSPIHRLDPRARILVLLMLVVALTLSRGALGLLLGVFAGLLGWWLARVPFGPLLRGWRNVFPFLLLLALLQVVLRAGADETLLFALGPVRVSPADLLLGAGLLLRFTGLLVVLGLGAAILSESEVTRALEALLRPLANIGLPVQDFVMMIQVTLRFFPLLSQIAERIAKAQASRGADWSPAGWNLVRRARQMAPIMVPLFVISLRRAENMALAMDARGYGSTSVRTSMVVLRFQRADFIALLLTAGLSVLVFVL